MSLQDINFWGSVYTTRLALPHLKESRGKIVAFASSASWLPAPRMSIYNVSNVILRYIVLPHILCQELLDSFTRYTGEQSSDGTLL